MAGVFCSLPLRVVEVGRNGYDGLRNFFTEELRSAFLEIAKYKCGNLRRCEHAIAHLKANHLLTARRDLKRNKAQIFLDVGAALSHESLYRIDRLARFGDKPIASFFAHEQAVLLVIVIDD